MSLTPPPAAPAAVELVTFEVRTAYFETFKREFAKLARKAAKLGVIAPTFTIVQKDKVIPGRRMDSGEVIPARVVNVITVTGQAPVLNGWTFAATLQHTEAGNLVHTVPGVDVQIKLDMRTAKPACEHCGLDRRRADTYVVVHTDGRQMQIGRTCLKDFTGHDSPEAVARWAELLGSFVRSCGDEDEEGTGGFNKPLAATLDVFIPFVCANIRELGWLSRTKARETGKEASANGAWSSLYPVTPADKKAAITPTDADIARATKVLEVARAYFEEKATEILPDYEHNLRIVIEGLTVDYRTAGIAASVVNFAERLMGREIERRRFEERKVSAEFVGEVGKRLDLVLTVEKVIDLESVWGVSHLHMFADAAGNSLKWFGTSERLEVGTTYNVRGTVKKHEEYKGMKQTLLTRCACTKYDPNAPAPEPKKARKPRAKKVKAEAAPATETRTPAPAEAPAEAPATPLTFEEKARAEHGRYFCRCCADRRIIAGASERYSMGIYAGRYCDPCWAKDGRNHDRKFDPMDAGEHYSEEDYS